MKRWSTCGAFGDEIFELSLIDLAKFLWTRELAPGHSVVISIGKSRRKAHPRAYHGSREEQLAEKRL